MLILALIAHVSSKLTADRYCRTLHLRTDLARGEAAAVKVLNSIAFVLAQVVCSSCAVPFGGEAVQAIAIATWVALPLKVVHFRIEFAMGVSGATNKSGLNPQYFAIIWLLFGYSYFHTLKGRERLAAPDFDHQ